MVATFVAASVLILGSPPLPAQQLPTAADETQATHDEPVRLEDEVTVKRYRQNGSVVELLPENDEFDTIHVDLAEQSMVIEGVVVGVIRDGMPLH